MTKYHVNPETGKPGVCTAKAGNCRYGIEQDQHASSAIDAQKLYEATQSTFNEEEKPVYKMEDEQEYWEEIRNNVGTLVHKGNEFAYHGDPGKSGLFCGSCHYVFPNDSDFAITRKDTACPECANECSGYDVGVALRVDSKKFLNKQEVLDTKWFHTSTYENWEATVGHQAAEGRDYVHLGTKDAARERNEIVAVNIDDDPLYIYEIEIDRSSSIEDKVYYEDPFDNRDLPKVQGSNSSDVTKASDEPGITRYVNHFESPGSISLVVDPSKIRILSKTRVN